MKSQSAHKRRPLLLGEWYRIWLGFEKEAQPCCARKGERKEALNIGPALLASSPVMGASGTRKRRDAQWGPTLQKERTKLKNRRGPCPNISAWDWNIDSNSLWMDARRLPLVETHTAAPPLLPSFMPPTQEFPITPFRLPLFFVFFLHTGRGAGGGGGFTPLTSAREGVWLRRLAAATDGAGGEGGTNQFLQGSWKLHAAFLRLCCSRAKWPLLKPKNLVQAIKKQAVEVSRVLSAKGAEEGLAGIARHSLQSVD